MAREPPLRPADVVRHFHERFTALGSPERAAIGRAYMKSALSFHGISMPVMRAECKVFAKAHPDVSVSELRGIVDALFATDGFDLRTAAITLLELRAADLGPSDLPWLIRLARAGACWAHVDYLATQVIDPLLRAHPRLLAKSRTWAKDRDFWVRRVALLAQLAPLRAGGGDFALFAELAEPMLDDKEFFIRKAIGWVLREVSKKRPALVRDFVVAHAPRLSAVTWNEATKYLPPAMKRQVVRERPSRATRSKRAVAPRSGEELS